VLRYRIAIFTGLLAIGLGIVYAAARYGGPLPPAPGPASPPALATHTQPATQDAPPDALPSRVPDTSPAPPSLRIGEIPEDLIARRLTLPVRGVSPSALTPQFYDARGMRGHEALDIMAAKGAPVIAAEDGTIAKLFVSAAGGLTVYQFDPTQTYVYYYAHLDRYAPGLAEGQVVRRGQTIAFVGMTGNATTPHLHFAISRVGEGGKWYGGEAIDPFPAFRGNDAPRPR
jgi:murein DD-endopeptidase MepM/ murein hydrolase activator NlpD